MQAFGISEVFGGGCCLYPLCSKPAGQSSAILVRVTGRYPRVLAEFLNRNARSPPAGPDGRGMKSSRSSSGRSRCSRATCATDDDAPCGRLDDDRTEAVTSRSSHAGRRVEAGASDGRWYSVKMPSKTDGLRARVARLHAKGEKVLEGAQPSGGERFVSTGEYASWRAQSEAALTDAFGKDSPYTRNFVAYSRSTRAENLEAQIGILSGALEAIDHGELQTFASLVIADVFENLIEMADHLHSSKYSVPAASLAGAVLEDALRRLCDANSVTYKKGDGIDALNKKLASSGVYDKFTVSSVDAWRHLRNEADHGNFQNVQADKVGVMLQGVRKFMTDYARELGKNPPIDS